MLCNKLYKEYTNVSQISVLQKPIIKIISKHENQEKENINRIIYEVGIYRRKYFKSLNVL